jgi:hypothetical protein
LPAAAIACGSARRHAWAITTLLDCTHLQSRRPWPRHTLLAALAIMIAAVLSEALAPAARADGDPASDVLLSQPLFLPQDAGVSATQQTQLAALLAAAGRNGYRLRVAVIARPADLGSVTALWHQPQNYARFLGQELSLNYNGPLLVLMPNGYGLYRPGGPNARERSALTVLPTPGRDLATSALTAIQRLAAASGHTLPAPTTTASPKYGSNDTTAWIVFAIGVALILLAWTASLRAQPPRVFGEKTSPT